MCIKNILVIGGGSEASLEFSTTYLAHESANFYGLTTKNINKNQKNGPIRLLKYDDLTKIQKIDFHLVCIFATRNPNENVSLNDYLKVNQKINDSIHGIKFSTPSAKVLFISTFSVYSNNSISINEESPLCLQDPYAKSKSLMEESLLLWSGRANIPVLIARMPVYLYRGVKTNFMSRLLRACRLGKTFTLTNKSKPFEAVFDTDHLVSLIRCPLHRSMIVNCSALADFTFADLANMAKMFGLSGVTWVETKQPSVQVSKHKLGSFLEVPSAKLIIENWFEKEIRCL